LPAFIESKEVAGWKLALRQRSNDFFISSLDVFGVVKFLPITGLERSRPCGGRYACVMPGGVP
jgi:hypothetical protein